MIIDNCAEFDKSKSENVTSHLLDNMHLSGGESEKKRKFQNRKNHSRVIASKMYELSEIYKHSVRGYFLRKKANKQYSCMNNIAEITHINGKVSRIGLHCGQKTFCPICAHNTTMKVVSRLMRAIEQAPSDTKYLFMTISPRNIEGGFFYENLVDGVERLRTLIRNLSHGKDCLFSRMGVIGYTASIEITRNNCFCSNYLGTFHPHIHLLLAVPESYFTGSNYLKLCEIDKNGNKKFPFAEKISRMLGWECFVSLNGLSKKETHSVDMKAVIEVSKYNMKLQDIHETETLDAMDFVLHGFHGEKATRLKSFGGIFKSCNVKKFDQEETLYMPSKKETAIIGIKILKFDFGTNKYIERMATTEEEKIYIRELKRRASRSEENTESSEIVECLVSEALEE